MSHGRRFRFPALRLRQPAARCAPAKSSDGQRGAGLHATGRTRHRAGREDSRLQAAGGRARYGGSKRQTRLPAAICAITGSARRFSYDLGVRKFRFLTNNPKKVVGLEGYGIQMVEQVPIQSEPNPHNAKYLETETREDGSLALAGGHSAHVSICSAKAAGDRHEARVRARRESVQRQIRAGPGDPLLRTNYANFRLRRVSHCTGCRALLKFQSSSAKGHGKEMSTQLWR